MLCDCALDQLCDACVADRFAQLRGVAACRGTTWARSVALRCAPTQPWPGSDRARAIARRKIEDLTRDTRLRDRLADECSRYAAREWCSARTIG